MLCRDWQPSTDSAPRPTLILEGGPFEWADNASFDEELTAALRTAGMYCEPYASWALCIYPIPTKEKE